MKSEIYKSNLCNTLTIDSYTEEEIPEVLALLNSLSSEFGICSEWYYCKSTEDKHLFYIFNNMYSKSNLLTRVDNFLIKKLAIYKGE